MKKQAKSEMTLEEQVQLDKTTRANEYVKAKNELMAKYNVAEKIRTITMQDEPTEYQIIAIAK